MAWIATKRFTYGGHELFPGEFCRPQGLVNDRIIFNGDSRFVQVVDKEAEDWRCDRCGRYFIGEGPLRGHQRSAYAAEQMSPERLQEVKRQADNRARRTLKHESVADLARNAGHNVEDKGGIPTIVA